MPMMLRDAARLPALDILQRTGPVTLKKLHVGSSTAAEIPENQGPSLASFVRYDDV